MHSDLLRQALRLAKLDPRRPRQVNLRRAISSAYYALFHFLVDKSCRVILGSQHRQKPYRHVLGRAFTHNGIKNSCKSFAGGTLKSSITKGLPKSFSIPSEIRDIARTFVELQYKRELADYDLTERFSRSDVLGLVEQVHTVIHQFNQLRNSCEKKFFLACLLAWDQLLLRK